MTAKNLLVELFVEELPPKALKKLGEAFASVLANSLRAQGLATDASTVTPFASPRRLAAHVTAVSAQAADKSVSQKLMPVSVGLTAAGEATPALLKKLTSVGASASDVPQLKRQMDGKAEALFFDSLVTGATLAQGLQKALDKTLAELPIPKVMQYQLADGWTSVNFVRPAHGLVAVHGDDVVTVQVLGLTAGRSTRGHRFEARVDPIELNNADEYAERLASDGAVIASFATRRDEIARQLQTAAAKQGLAPIHDDALLDEVTALVERPNVLTCQFEPAFLDVPPECLILTMKANQKYFPLLDAAGKLTNQFLVVSNIRPADPSRVIEGNERVVRPRLADAKFFFDQDRKRTLESRVAGLDQVVYHGKLGTQGERVLRVRAIAKAIGQQLGGDALAAQADRAAMLAKADLLTDMVGEFPELQGIMGGYYAEHDGESTEVAQAVEDHYKPRFAGDSLPRNAVGIIVALADKLETLLGMFEIGEIPTGDKDPFALRRHALGVLRMCMERKLRFALDDLVSEAGEAWSAASAAAENDRWLDQARRGMVVTRPSLALFQASITAQRQKVRQGILSFMRERLAVTLRDQGFGANEVDSVLVIYPLVVADVPERLAAVRSFTALPESSALAAANKRVGNILKKAETSVVPILDEALLKEPAEVVLYGILCKVAPVAEAAFERREYTASLKALAALRAPVDAFFESVMVNAEDPALRANRLGLLAALHAAMNRVADLSKLAS
jgi:glycyl-tRNA synthetase beta chain